VIGAAASSFCGLVLVRLSPDSAFTKNAIANVIASQKIPRNAFDLFIFLFCFCTPAFRIVFLIDTEPQLTLHGSTPAILRRRFQKRQAEFSAWNE